MRHGAQKKKILMEIRTAREIRLSQCASQPFFIVTKYLASTTLKEERFILLMVSKASVHGHLTPFFLSLR
jgi:hypothetical protein